MSAAKSDDLDSIPGPHMVEGKNLLHKLLSDRLMLAMACGHATGISN